MPRRTPLVALKACGASIGNHLLSPKFMARFHATATCLWIVLIIPSLLIWSDSVLWVIVMSLWANVASHWAGFQASRGEQRVKEQDNQGSSNA